MSDTRLRAASRLRAALGGIAVLPHTFDAIAQNVSGTIGGYAGIGEYPDISFDPDNPPLTIFLQLSGYF